MAAMKKTVLILSVLWVLAGTAPAPAAVLGENPRLGENFLNTSIGQAAGDVNRDRLPGSCGSCLERPAECFVAPGRAIMASDGLAVGLADTSVSIPSRAARYTYLRTFRSAAFQEAAERAGYTAAELKQLRGQLLGWSKSGSLRLELNPLLGGFATTERATVGLVPYSQYLVGIQRPVTSVTAHEMGHLLQEVRFGALTAEEAGTLTRSQILRYELGAESIGHWAVGKELGWWGTFRAYAAAYLH
jgi:hypothetical protein